MKSSLAQRGSDSEPPYTWLISAASSWSLRGNLACCREILASLARDSLMHFLGAFLAEKSVAEILGLRELRLRLWAGSSWTLLVRLFVAAWIKTSTLFGSLNRTCQVSHVGYVFQLSFCCAQAHASSPVRPWPVGGVTCLAGLLKFLTPAPLNGSRSFN